MVEPIDGLDNLPPRSTSSALDARAGSGVLVDHLVPGSKESRIADGRAARRHPAGTC